jgi:hypothetical protein
MNKAIPSVVVLANCIHESISKVLRKSGLFSKVGSIQVYTVPEEERDKAASSLGDYDFILTLEHAEGYGALSTASLRNSFGARVFALPTPFFSGMMPDMSYLTLHGEISRAPGVLGDYHSALILAECADGLSEEEIVRRYSDGSAFDRLDVQGVWNAGIAELQRREINTEIKLSEYIIERKNQGRIGDDFLSFNHPREGLINYIALSFFRLSLGVDLLDSPLLPKEHNLYQDARWPLHPAVAERLGLPVHRAPLFKTPDRLGGEEFSISEFARRSFRFFTSASSPADFKVMTPNFLGHYMRGSGSSQSVPAPVTTSFRPQAMAPKVNLCIIGAAKAGTTSLFDALSRTPDIEGSNVKEVRFFHAHYDKGIDWYHKHFSFNGARVVLEATPEYANPVLCPTVPERMAVYNPDMKLIYCVRDPVLRLRSQINHFRKSLPQAYPNDRGCIASSEGFKNFIARSLYNHAASAFLRHFPESQLHIFDLDDPDSMTKLSGFLGMTIGDLPKSNVRAENSLPVEKVVGWLRETGYYELIRSDTFLFRQRFGVGVNWRIINGD